MPNDLLTQGIAAIKAGNIQEARRLLDLAIHASPNDERTWGWFYSVCVNDKERIRCLKEVLRINPNNQRAKQKYDELLTLEPPISSYAPNVSIPQSRVNKLPQSRNSGKQNKLIPSVVIAIFVICLLCIVAFIVSNINPKSPQSFTPVPPTITRPPTASINPEVRKARWATVDIRDLAKNPDKYIGYELHYTGEVFNIQEDSNGAVIQVWVQIPGGDEFDREAVVVYWYGTTTNIYEGTTIEFWGYGQGSFEGTNSLGGTIAQPLISAEYITYFR
jgi:tetratricopeptide (TPR) repeat protein